MLSKTHTSRKALAESSFPLKCSKKSIIILSFTIFYLHCIHLGHMKLANIPRAFGFISLNLQTIEKNTTSTPPKTMQIFWILNHSTPKQNWPFTKTAMQLPMILEAHLSIEMKENLRKPGGETKTGRSLPRSDFRSERERRNCWKIRYFCKHL